MFKLSHLFICAVCISACVLASGVSLDDVQEAVRKLAERVEKLEATVKKLSSGKGGGHSEDGAKVDDKYVNVLTGDNFDEKVQEKELNLVEFYAPWCGHCKALAPEYATAAEELKDHPSVALSKVDCTADSNKNLCEKYGVNGYPTIKVIRKSGAVSDYNGERNADAIVKFLKKQAQPAVTTLSSADEAKSFASEDPVKIIAFLGSKDSDAAYKAVAEKLRNDYSFGLVHGHDNVATQFGAKAPALVMIRDFDTNNAVYSGDLTSEADITTWVKSESFPILGTIGPENYMRYVERGLNFVWIFYDPDVKEQEALLNGDILKVATEHRTKLSFVKLDGKMWGEHAKNFGLGSKLPGVAIEDRQSRKQYVFDPDTELNAGSFGNFIKGYLNGSIKPHMKSEPEPTDNSGPVKVIVGTTFESIVMDSTKDVLVEFYAPWCGHCKQLAPKYDDLGRQYAQDGNIIIAKIDATANDTPIEVSGFPTIKFFPAGDKQNPIDYNGDRTAAAMAEFIEENRKSSPLKSEL